MKKYLVMSVNCMGDGYEIPGIAVVEIDRSDVKYLLNKISDFKKVAETMHGLYWMQFLDSGWSVQWYDCDASDYGVGEDDERQWVILDEFNSDDLELCRTDHGRIDVGGSGVLFVTNMKWSGTEIETPILSVDTLMRMQLELGGKKD